MSAPSPSCSSLKAHLLVFAAHGWAVLSGCSQQQRSATADPAIADARQAAQEQPATGEDLPGKPDLEILRRAERIELRENNRDGSARRSFVISSEDQLAQVRAWIQRYAWPPLDGNSVGAVIARGQFEIFERSTDSTPAFSVGICAQTSRGEPQEIHVTDRDWARLMAILGDE